MKKGAGQNKLNTYVNVWVQNVNYLKTKSEFTKYLQPYERCDVIVKRTWSETRSRSRSIRHDAPAACLRTWTCGDRGKVCAWLPPSPRPRAASRRWPPAAAAAGRSRTSSAPSAACCTHTVLRKQHRTEELDQMSEGQQLLPLRGTFIMHVVAGSCPLIGCFSA